MLVRDYTSRGENIPWLLNHKFWNTARRCKNTCKRQTHNNQARRRRNCEKEKKEMTKANGRTIHVSTRAWKNSSKTSSRQMAEWIWDNFYAQATQPSQLPLTPGISAKHLWPMDPVGWLWQPQMHPHSLGKSTPTGTDHKTDQSALR